MTLEQWCERYGATAYLHLMNQKRVPKSNLTDSDLAGLNELSDYNVLEQAAGYVVLEASKLFVGLKVWWNDPDEFESCSGWKTITSLLEGGDVAVLDEGTEVFTHELQITIEGHQL